MKNLINIKTFPKAFIRWCVCGGFVLATLEFLILIDIIHVEIVNADYSGRYKDSLQLSLGVTLNFFYIWGHLFLLLLLSVPGGIVVLRQYRHQKPQWIRSSVIMLILVILLLLWILIWCKGCLDRVGWDWELVNKTDVIPVLVIMSAVIVWFTIWLITLCIYSRTSKEQSRSLTTAIEK